MTVGILQNKKRNKTTEYVKAYIFIKKRREKDHRQEFYSFGLFSFELFLYLQFYMLLVITLKINKNIINLVLFFMGEILSK